jgi:hypothetical protein
MSEPADQSWASAISIDLLTKVAKSTVLHPFVAWMVPLGFRAQAMSWTNPQMHYAIAYATLLTVLYLLDSINSRVAYGKPRPVNLSEEVIVITGGASGLGLLIAEVYGLRGATVAVLDVKKLDLDEVRGVTAYECDVGDMDQLKHVAAKIEKEVCTAPSSQTRAL